MTKDSIVVVAAKRTAPGGMLGDFAALAAACIGGGEATAPCLELLES